MLRCGLGSNLNTESQAALSVVSSWEHYASRLICEGMEGVTDLVNLCRHQDLDLTNVLLSKRGSHSPCRGSKL